MQNLDILLEVTQLSPQLLEEVTPYAPVKGEAVVFRVVSNVLQWKYVGESDGAYRPIYTFPSIQAYLPYQEYIAKVSQNGTAAPVATVLNGSAPNFISGITYRREDVFSGESAGTIEGLYHIVFPTAIDTNKIFYSIGRDAVDHDIFFKLQVGNNTFLVLRTMDSNGDTYDSYIPPIAPIFITIRVYN